MIRRYGDKITQMVEPETAIATFLSSGVFFFDLVSKQEKDNQTRIDKGKKENQQRARLYQSEKELVIVISYL